MTDKIVVLSTCQTGEEARKLARHLVERRLAACVNIVPNATSVYRWQDKIEESAEFVLLIKTRRDLVKELSQELAKMHSYQVPEVIALTIVDGTRRYLEWLERELAPANDD
jgi:periplasmic divalent cation tolerance protein